MSDNSLYPWHSSKTSNKHKFKGALSVKTRLRDDAQPRGPFSLRNICQISSPRQQGSQNAEETHIYGKQSPALPSRSLTKVPKPGEFLENSLCASNFDVRREFLQHRGWGCQARVLWHRNAIFGRGIFLWITRGVCTPRKGESWRAEGMTDDINLSDF